MSEQVPSIGRIVHVRTPEPMNGQHVHAAIITQVWSDGFVNLMVFPGSGLPLSLGSVYHQSHPQAGERHWFWPPHVPPRST